MAANGITISPRRVLDTDDEGEFESKTQAASEVPDAPAAGDDPNLLAI